LIVSGCDERDLLPCPTTAVQSQRQTIALQTAELIRD